MDDPRPDLVLLRTLRTRTGLTQAELGRRVGTTQSAMARWERGAVSASLRTVQRLAQACHRRLDTDGGEDLRPDAVVVDLDGTSVAVASLDDVIRSKEAADRSKDRLVLPALRELRRRR